MTLRNKSSGGNKKTMVGEEMRIRLVQKTVYIA